MLSSTATRQRSSWTSSSWKDDSSQITQSACSTAVSGAPTFPATATSRPAARNIAPISSVVVVLPFVPVTPTSGRSGWSRQPSSTSDQTGMPRARAAATSGRSPGTPGLFTRTSIPSRSESSSSFPSERSTRTTSSPRRTSASAAAAPDRASP